VGWSQRSYQFLSAYARLGDVELFAIDIDGGGVLCSRAELRRLCRTVVIQQPGSDGWQRVAAQAAQAIARADLVHVSRTVLWWLALAAPPQTPVAVDLDENPLAWLASKQRCERALGLQSNAPAPTRAHLVRELREVAARASIVWFASDMEVERAPAMLRSVPVRAIPNPTALPPPRTRRTRPRAPTMLFVGNLGFFPNIDGVRLMVERILPRIRTRIPEVELLIVGRGPAHELRDLDGRGFNIVTDVPDLAPYYRRATICVAPIRYGSGTRVKILESFGHGVPVVSTTLGCEGLDVADRRELLIADGPRAFADACHTLLTDERTRAALARNALRFARQRHAPAKIQARILADARALLAR
jgi:glycosyltransferase involved in cell wall biosynthesis